MDDATPARPSPEPSKPAANPVRRRLLLAVAAVLAVSAIGYGLWWLLAGSHRVSTDDAYVTADVAQITPLYAAAVREVRVHDTQAVRKGEVLVILDDTDARIAATQADAELARAIRRVRGYRNTDAALAGQLDARTSDVAHAESQVTQAESGLSKAQADLSRRQSVLARGAVSAEEVTPAENALTIARTTLAGARSSLAQARANRATAQAQLEANHALTDGLDLADNPEVVSYRARAEQAHLDLSRTVLRAPLDGIVAKRQVQAGQRVAVGTALMTVVPATDLVVDANFKEQQLRRVRIGQTARLTSDLYGGGVSYRGVVIGRGGGTGSAFAIIPAQNATGNWIKVVQRVPIRIRLDAKDLRDHPLLVGLSMKADVDLDSGPARGGGS